MKCARIEYSIFLEVFLQRAFFSTAARAASGSKWLDVSALAKLCA